MDVIHIQIFPFEKCCALGYNFKNQNTIVDNFLAVIFCLVIEPLARKLLLRYTRPEVFWECGLFVGSSMTTSCKSVSIEHYTGSVGHRNEGVRIGTFS